MKSPLLSLRNITLTFGVKPLFTNLSLNIYPYDRICLVGRNGEGKSSLFKVICGDYELDDGERWALPGVSVGYLPQQIDFAQDLSVHDYVLQGLEVNDPNKECKYLVDIVITPLKLDPNAMLSELSGGLLRRAFLAKTLVSLPDILLLDEPTNHLDIETIEWLEEYLKSYKGAIICISHDRAFLRNISSKTFWLDRGIVKTNEKGYGDFDRWSIELLEQEQRELNRLEKKLDEEEVWKIQGVTARRKRNQKRLQDLYQLRERIQRERASQRQFLNKITLDPLAPTLSSKMVCEFNQVNKSYEGKLILESFSMRIMKGDKIGVIGRNGTGKTTFLKLLVGDELPDSGTVKLGKTVEITYSDQRREALNPDETIWKTLVPSGDYLQVGSNQMHVVAYLKNFLFDPKQARDKVATLSGGQANRLLLAKALAAPGSLLILDEPTNDLDMDTLDMIQDILAEYQGTLIIVSHDRAFLDSLVTKTLYFEGEGAVEEFVGSYDDIKKRQSNKVQHKLASNKAVKEEMKRQDKVVNKKLSYSAQRELDLLPEKVSHLEEKIKVLEAKLADANFYEASREEFFKASSELENTRQELSVAWERWQELENMRDGN